MFSLWPLLCLTLTQVGQTQLSLTASSATPFAGETVEVFLSLRLSSDDRAALAAGQATLEIPWLNAEFVDWLLPAEQWVCRHTQAGANPACRLNGYPTPLRLEPGENETYRLRRQLRVRDALGAQPLAFEPVRLRIAERIVSSNPVTLTVQPRPANVPPGLFLGVGDLRLDAAVQPPQLLLGEETVFSLTVQGGRDLASVSWPRLESIDEFRQAFLIEPDTETWNEEKTARTFRFRLKPRRAIEALPAIAYSCFDPRLGRYQARRTSALPLLVRAEETTRLAPPYPPGLIPERLRLTAVGPALLESPPAWPKPIILVLVLLAPPILCGGVWLFRRRLFPASWPAAGRSWSGPGLEAMRHIQLALKRPPREAAERIDGLVRDYLRRRFQLGFVEPTAVELENRLQLAGVPHSGIQAVQALREVIDTLRFAPGDGDARVEAPLERCALEAIKALEESPP